MRTSNQWSTILPVAFLVASLFPIIAIATEPSVLSQAAEKATRATVGVLASRTDHPRRSRSPAFSIKGSATHLGQGYILTAQHAAEHPASGHPPETIHVMTSDFYEYEAHLVGSNAVLDIAVYHIPATLFTDTLDHAMFAQRESRTGEEVFTVGYPLGWGPALSFGRVGNRNTFLDTIQSRLLQVDLSACRGNSGGGLFNKQGEIVGVIHAIIQTEARQGERRCSRFAFAVPGRVVNKIVHSLLYGDQRLTFSTLGLQLSVVKREHHWAVAVGKASGTARETGFKKGDIILAIDAYPIHTAAQLKQYLLEHTQPGQQVNITVLRNEQPQTLPLRLGSS